MGKLRLRLHLTKLKRISALFTFVIRRKTYIDTHGKEAENFTGDVMNQNVSGVWRNKYFLCRAGTFSANCQFQFNCSVSESNIECKLTPRFKI